MLVTSRKFDGTDKSRLHVRTSDGWVTIEILALRSGSCVSVGVSAPMKCEIYRGEILPKTMDEPLDYLVEAVA